MILHLVHVRIRTGVLDSADGAKFNLLATYFDFCGQLFAKGLARFFCLNMSVVIANVITKCKSN